MIKPVFGRPDIVIVMTDEERAIPPYESGTSSTGGSARCPASAGSTNTGELHPALHRVAGLCPQPSHHLHRALPDLHGVTQTDGLGRSTTPGCAGCAREVPTLGNWFRRRGYDTHYDGKWRISTPT